MKRDIFCGILLGAVVMIFAGPAALASAVEEREVSESRMLVRNSSKTLKYTVTLSHEDLGDGTLSLDPGEEKRIEDFPCSKMKCDTLDCLLITNRHKGDANETLQSVYV